MRALWRSPSESSIGGDGSYGDLGIKEDSTENLVHDFLECVRERTAPYASLEDAHRSTTFAHIANIALKIGGRLEWDAVTESFSRSPEANELLHYEYRAPWSLD